MRVVAAGGAILRKQLSKDTQTRKGCDICRVGVVVVVAICKLSSDCSDTYIYIVYPIDCRLFVLVIVAAVISCNRSKCRKGRHALFNSTPKKKEH